MTCPPFSKDKMQFLILDVVFGKRRAFCSYPPISPILNPYLPYLKDSN